MKGEVSSYTEIGDTASATLTIPNKPPVPIRFKRENGQWKIDAISSNERLLESLKQTRIWNQHAEIEAVLENARTAYAAKEWQKLADCFTRTGKYRWALRTYSKMPQEDGGLPFLEDRKDFRVNFDQFLNCPANESDAVLITLIESLPDDLINLMVTATAVQSTGQPKEVFRFEFDGVRIADLNVVGDIATAKLGGTADTAPVPVRFVQHAGQWKIDAIGTPEELQQQVLKSLQRQHGASPSAAVEAFREAMADGRFQSALNCMTEDARNEWLGEMLVGCCHEAEHLRASEFVSRYESSDLVDLGKHTGGQLNGWAGHLKAKFQPGAFPLSADERRSAVIELARLPQVPAQMLSAFLMVRLTHQPDLFAPANIGEFEEIPLDRDGPEVMKYRLQPASPDQQPLELDIIQIDGLWKLNTIIDPALKPWPLPAEEPTPPAEATPLDGATSVP